MGHSPGASAGVAPNGRREFVANLVLSFAGTLGLGGVAVRFLQYLYPVVLPEQIIEVSAVRRDQVPTNGGIIVNLPTGHVALVDVDGDLRACSAVCTHLGCIVRWEPTEHHALYCACHGGMFDRQGQVVGGPPPRPLPSYPVEVRNGQVFIKIKVRPPVLGA